MRQKKQTQREIVEQFKRQENVRRKLGKRRRFGRGRRETKVQKREQRRNEKL